MFKLSSNSFNFLMLNPMLKEISSQGAVIGELHKNEVVTAFSHLSIIKSSDIESFNDGDKVAIIEKNGFFYGMSIIEFKSIMDKKKAYLAKTIEDEKRKKNLKKREF